MIRLLRALLRRPKPAILQGESAECGLACLANIASAYGFEADLRLLRNQFPLSIKGMSLPVILQIAAAMNFNGRALRLEVDSLQHLRLPAILHWNMSHFVVLERVSTFMGRRTFHILDPASGRQLLAERSVSGQFTGVALELEPTADFTQAALHNRIKIRNLWSHSAGLWSAGAQLVIAAMVSQLIFAITPLFMQAAIDSVIPTGDRNLLDLLGVIFVGLVVIAGASSLTRSLLANRLGQRIGYQTGVNLVNHLLSLPLAWFEKRQVADLISRLGSTEPIANFVSQQAFNGVVWGTGLIVYGLVVAFYSPLLALLVVTSLLLYLIVKMVAVREYNIRNHEAILAQTLQSGMLIESLEGIAAIKAFGAERQRLSLWANARARTASAELRLVRIQSVIDVLRPALTSLEEVGFVLIAVRAVLAGNLTIGMVFAASLYKQQAMYAGTSLIDLLGSMRQLNVHLDRLSDIVSEPRPQRKTGLRNTDFRGRVEFDNVHFSYGSGEPEILSGISFIIEPGQNVAIVGRSGQGKSTIAKILLGLLVPTSGKVFIDNVDLAMLDGDAWRSHLGYVAQDDDLFAGSLAENIAFFETEIDVEAVEWAARVAVIHDDIERMPMKYDTLAGDMGSTLSGGQKARVLLARAIYKKPEILLLDEGSAHLDVETEAAINKSIGLVSMTRISVAHRAETIRQADRVLEIKDGAIFERPVPQSDD